MPPLSLFAISVLAFWPIKALLTFTNARSVIAFSILTANWVASTSLALRIVAVTTNFPGTGNVVSVLAFSHKHHTGV